MKPAVILSLPINPLLKEAIGQAADKAGLAMNEWIANLAAEHLGCPELAEIPRKPLGRPRNVMTPPENGSKKAKVAV